jgi:hypothetical protein
VRFAADVRFVEDVRFVADVRFAAAPLRVFDALPPLAADFFDELLRVRDSFTIMVSVGQQGALAPSTAGFYAKSMPQRMRAAAALFPCANARRALVVTTKELAPPRKNYRRW